jgi:hypothetical protein
MDGDSNLPKNKFQDLAKELRGAWHAVPRQRIFSSGPLVEIGKMWGK